MNKKAVVEVENISKVFFPHKNKTRHERSLRTEISRLVSTLSKRKKNHQSAEPFLALQNVSFTLNRGESLGILGLNGSGKSTLLKILARVTSPTSGRAKIYGRLSALLEVGVGFQPDLSGKENVFLSGCLLGMKKKEIQDIYPEIVAFAEIENFIDVPVKKYSSGMFMRLAFSLMVHIKSDILLIDEILAVGDHLFQEKCNSKITQLLDQGTSIIFVSHSLPAMVRLCQKGLWLERGKVRSLGPADKIAEQFSAPTQARLLTEEVIDPLIKKQEVPKIFPS